MTVRRGACGIIAMFLLFCCLQAMIPSSAFAATDSVRVLFVGNSFTANKGSSVSECLRAIAKAQGEPIVVNRVSYGGANLSDYAFPLAGVENRRQALERKLANGTWDYVVLQEQTKLGAVHPATKMYSSIRALRQLVSRYQPKAKVLLYATHGYESSERLEINGVERALSASDLELREQSAYTRIGEKLGLPVVQVGASFYRHQTTYPFDDLVAADGKHPDSPGYYLAACAFYQAIFNKLPANAASGVAGVDAAMHLRMLATLSAPVTTMEPARVVLSESETCGLDFSTGDSYLVYGTCDYDIARVGSDRRLVAVAEGSTVAYVESDRGTRATCAVEVESDRLQREKLLFSQRKITLDIGDVCDSPLRVSQTLDDYELEWSSSDDEVAAVNELGEVVARKAGKATIGVRDAVSGREASYTVYVRLDAPVDLSVAKVFGKSALQVTWSRVAGAQSYRVYRANGYSSEFEFVRETSRRTLVDKGVRPNVRARYHVVACLEDSRVCDSPESANAVGIVLRQPSMTAKARAQAGSIRLSWDANYACTGYKIYRAVGKSGDFGLLRTIEDPYREGFTDFDVSKGKTYRYKVRAYRVLGENTFNSPFSRVRSAKMEKAKLTVGRWR